MTTNSEIVVQPHAEVAQHHELLQTPMQLLSHAVQQGNTVMVETLARLAQQSREKDEVAAFNRSMHTAQGEMRRIGADATNPQTRSKYLTYAKLDAALRPIYTQQGFSVSFNTAPGPNTDVLRVVAYVSHQDGYTREYQIDMPADGKGAKGGDVMTKTHATGAAASYGARYLLKMIFNVAVGETDDDGNGAAVSQEAPKRPQMNDADLIARLEHIEAAQNQTELKKIAGAAHAAATSIGDQEALKAIDAAYQRRKAAL